MIKAAGAGEKWPGEESMAWWEVERNTGFLQRWLTDDVRSDEENTRRCRGSWWGRDPGAALAHSSVQCTVPSVCSRSGRTRGGRTSVLLVV